MSSIIKIFSNLEIEEKEKKLLWPTKYSDSNLRKEKRKKKTMRKEKNLLWPTSSQAVISATPPRLATTMERSGNYIFSFCETVFPYTLYWETIFCYTIYPVKLLFHIFLNSVPALPVAADWNSQLSHRGSPSRWCGRTWEDKVLLSSRHNPILKVDKQTKRQK